MSNIDHPLVELTWKHTVLTVMLWKNPEMSPELTHKERTSYCHAEVPVGVPCNYSTGPKDASHDAASGSRFLEAFASDSNVNVDAPAKSLSLQLLDTQGAISEARFYHVPWQKVSGIARSIAQECPIKPVWCPMTHWEENMEDVSRFGTQPSRLDSLKIQDVSRWDDDPTKNNGRIIKLYSCTCGVMMKKPFQKLMVVAPSLPKVSQRTENPAK